MGKYSWLNRLPQLSYDDINNRLNDLNYLDIYDDLVSKISPMFKDNEIPQDILENLKFYSRRVNEVRNKNFSITDGILRQDGVKVKHVDKKFVLSLLNWIKKDQDKLNTSIKEKTGKNPGLDLYDEKLAQAALPKYNSDILNDNEDLVDKLIDSQKFYDGFVERTKDDKSKLADLARARAKSDIGYYISEALKKGISVEDLQSLGIKLSGDYKKDFSRSKNFATIYENIRKKYVMN